jgi:hypothetical protein
MISDQYRIKRKGGAGSAQRWAAFPNSTRSGFDLEFKLRTVETDLELHEKVHLSEYQRHIITGVFKISYKHPERSTAHNIHSGA